MTCFIVTSRRHDGLVGKLCREEDRTCRYCHRICRGEITSPKQILRELPEPIIGFRHFLFTLPPGVDAWLGSAVIVPGEYLPPPQPISAPGTA